MAQIVIMPKLGQTVEESTLLKWHKKAGDPVRKGEILFDIETDKAVLEVESFFEGTLLKILVNEGQTVPVTAPVAFVGKPGEPLPDVPAPAPAARAAAPAAAPSPAAPARAASALPAPGPAAAPAPAPAAPPAPSKKAVSPRARRLARECGIRTAPIAGSGPGGRVIERDVRAYLDARNYAGRRITPAAKNLAIAEDIDLIEVAPDDSGRVTVEAVQRAIAEKPREMTRIRQIIAQRLAQSMQAAPHFYVTVCVDLTGLMEFRKALKAQNKSYSVTDFILMSCAAAIKEFPAFNSVTDGRRIWWRSRINLGLAVDVREGLVVPVIRDAGGLSLDEMSGRIAELVGKAREGRLAPDEMSGGTFTVSNMGMMKIDNFTAIINPGESAILAVSSLVPTPMVVKGGIEIRQVMKITVSSDHRIIDGAMAARFANRVKNQLEDIESWKNMT